MSVNIRTGTFCDSPTNSRLGHYKNIGMGVNGTEISPECFLENPPTVKFSKWDSFNRWNVHEISSNSWCYGILVNAHLPYHARLFFYFEFKKS